MALVTEVGTISGSDPELRFTSSGKAVCNFDIYIPAVRANPEKGIAGEEKRYRKVTAWEQLGENAAESLRQGDRVIVRGTLKCNKWEGQDGQPKEREELTAWNIGPDLSYATAEVVRNEREEASAPAAPGYEKPF